jgi:hypothetical protein
MNVRAHHHKPCEGRNFERALARINGPDGMVLPVMFYHSSSPLARYQRLGCVLSQHITIITEKGAVGLWIA